MIVRYKKLSPDAVEPVRGSEWAAGWDLTACAVGFDDENDVIVYSTGIAVEIPRGYVGLLFPRSSIYQKNVLQTNSVGVIDADYRGEILVKFALRSGRGANGPRIYDVGDRIVQLVIVPVPEVAWLESETLSETARGTGGYGSSGA